MKLPRPDTRALAASYEAVMRALAKVVTDRRWAAPLSAMALGFGLFLGVAIGPGTAGSFATGSGPIIAIAEPSEDPEAGGEEAGGEQEATTFSPESESSGDESEVFEAPLGDAEYESEPLTEPAPEEEETETEAPPAEEEEAETQLLAGTVVHANPAAGSYTLAISGGELVSVHAKTLPVPGAKLKVEGEPLANSTFAELDSERAGSGKRADVRGVVTYVDPDPAAPAYALSGRGSSILVQVPPSPAPQLPALGAYASVGIAIQKPAEPVATEADPAAEPDPAQEAPPSACAPDEGLQAVAAPARVAVQVSFEAEPEPATYVDLAAVVTGLCPETGQLLLSADDTRRSEADLLLAVPKSIKTAKLEVGDSVVATATIAEDGTLTLAGLASDEGLKGAEDAASAQGDLKR